jgi:glycosyltransferase involved in cell wall biosynthesis
MPGRRQSLAATVQLRPAAPPGSPAQALIEDEADLRRPARVVADSRLGGRRRVRVTYVVPSLEIGGAERQLVKLVNNLDRTAFEAAIVCLGADPALLGEVAAHVRVRNLGLRSAGRLRRFRRLARGLLLGPIVLLDLTLHRPQVVHAYLPAGFVVGCLVARLARIPAVMASRMSLSRIADYPHRSLRLLANPANRVIDFQVCDSEAARSVVVGTEHVEGARTAVIHSGSQLPDMSGQPPAAPPTWRLEAGEPVAVSLANLTWQKSHEVLLRATAKVVASSPSFRLVLIGEGPERSRIEGLVEALGLGGRVVLAGSVTEGFRLLRNFRFSVLSSRQESFPNAVVESMAAGVPVIATSVGGIPEVIRDGIDGTLVPPGDPDALAEAMLKLLLEPQLAARMGQAARERISRSFSIEKMVREFEDLYLYLVRSPAGRR